MAGDYEQRVTRVLDYINSDPGGDMSLDTLADIAAMSRFHWHRVFAAMTGETCAQAVRRLRLHRAASLLVTDTQISVAEVARAVGYGSVHSFTRAFSDSYGCAPVRFRTRGDMVSPLSPPQKGDYPMHPVEIVQSPARSMAGLHHTGSYMEIGQKFDRLAALAGARNLWPQTQGMVGLYWDDPKSVAEEALRSFAGLLLNPGVPVPEGLEAQHLPAGEMAVMHYTGPYAGMPAAYDYLFGVWLPQSGRELLHQPCFEHYLNDPRQVAPEEIKTDICALLKPAED